MLKNPEEVQNILRELHNDIIDALKTLGNNPLDFYMESEETLRLFDTNKFSSASERNSMALRTKKQASMLVKVMKSKCGFSERDRLNSLLEYIEGGYFVPFLRSARDALFYAYNKNSKYWALVYRIMRMRGVNGCISSVMSEFYSKIDNKNIDYKTASSYVYAVRRFDMNEIQKFEELYTMAEVEEYHDSTKYDFLQTLESASMIETGIKKYGKVYSLSLNLPRRISICGSSGSGKTICKELWMEFYANSHKIIHLNDVNSEVWYTKRPSRRLNDLAEFGKQPKGIDIQIFSLPPFREEANNNEMKKIDHIFSINPRSLHIIDWVALLDLNSTQQIGFSRAYRTIDKLLTVNQLIDTIKVSDMHPGTRSSIITKLENLSQQGVFNDGQEDKLADMILDDKNYSFDTSLIYDEALKRGVTSYILRLVADAAKRRKQKKPFLIVIEELHDLVYGYIKNTRFEQYMQQLLKRLRVANVSVIIVQQNIDDVPDFAVGNISDWIVMKIRDSKQLEKLRKSVGFDLAMYIDVVPLLEAEHCLFISSSEKDAIIGRVIPPSCDHKFPMKR